MTRSACLLCGGYGSRHDPIAHDAEPTEDTLCGECDERWIETPSGLAKCPNCYPRENVA